MLILILFRSRFCWRRDGAAFLASLSGLLFTGASVLQNLDRSLLDLCIEVSLRHHRFQPSQRLKTKTASTHLRRLALLRLLGAESIRRSSREGFDADVERGLVTAEAERIERCSLSSSRRRGFVSSLLSISATSVK